MEGSQQFYTLEGRILEGDHQAGGAALNGFEPKASNADKHCPKHWYLIGFRYNSPRLSGVALATTEPKIKRKIILPKQEC